MMRKLSFFLRPSWLILAVLVAGFAYLCFTVLAPWQLGKNIDTAHRNELIADSVEADPVAVTSVLDGDPDNHTEWRRVTATGSYVPDSTVLVRLRHLDGAPGYAVLATFELTDGRVLLVDRGLVAALAGARPPPIPDPPAGTQRIEARVRASEDISQDKLPMTEDGFRQVYTINTEQEAAVLQQELTPIPTGEGPGYLQLAEGQPGAFSPTPLPQLDAGPYLSYGLQWLAFGIMAPLGLGYFVWAELRERRSAKAGSSGAGASATSTAPAGAPPNPNPPNDSPVTDPPSAESRLADRYGRS